MSNADTETDGNQGFRVLRHLTPPPRAPKPTPVLERFPMQLLHPEHVPPRQPTMHERVEDQHHLWGSYRTTWAEPGNPERWPNVVVNNAREEGEACALGYRPMCTFDPTATARREVPDNLVVVEYPKFLASHDRIVNSEAEELRLNGGAPALPPVPAQAPAPPQPPPQEMLALRAEVAALRAAQAAPATPSIGARNRTEAQARLVAGVSHSVWRKLIRSGHLAPDRQADPIAIVAAQEAARQADEAARVATENSDDSERI